MTPTRSARWVQLLEFPFLKLFGTSSQRHQQRNIGHLQPFRRTQLFHHEQERPKPCLAFLAAPGYQKTAPRSEPHGFRKAKLLGEDGLPSFLIIPHRHPACAVFGED